MKHVSKKSENKEKKPKKSSVWKKTYKTFFDIPTWVGYEHIKQTHQSLWGAVKGNLKLKKKGRQETFDEAMARYNYTEKDLEARQVFNQKMFLLFGLAGTLGVFYAGYLFWNGHFLGGMIAVGVSVLLFSRMFVYSFWNFQIKNRKLGCTFQEWWRGKVEENAPEKPKE